MEKSEELYQYVAHNILSINPSVFSMHYIMPDIKGIRSILDSLEAKRMIIIADAGSRCVTKAAGLSKKIDIFTPDAAEIPAYVQHLLFELDASETITLIKKAI